MKLLISRVNKLYFIAVFLLFLQAGYSQPYTVTQEFFTNLFSDDDIIGTPNPWIISGANVPTFKYFSDCAGVRLLGGFEILSGDPLNPAWVSKTWANLPPHYSATISMKIYKIDSWSSDSFFIMIDGVSTQIYTWGTTTGTTDLCGQTNPLINSYNPQYNQFIQTYTATITHTSPTLTLKLISSLQSWTGSWGIRELIITLNRCHLSCLTCQNGSICTSCDTANGLALVGQFCQCSILGRRKLIQTGCSITNCVSCISTTCPAGYYNFNSTSCASCSPACATCTGPGSIPPDCTSCNSVGYIIDPGTGTCAVCFGLCNVCTGLLQNQCTSCQPMSFLNVNRCLTTCPSGYYGSQTTHQCKICNSPCSTCIGATSNFCLTCVTGFYLYKTTCSNPCPFSMYGYNGLCVASCPLGTYPDTTTIPLCFACPAFCQTCDQTGKCITCTVGSYFSPYDNLCHNPCPVFYYGDPITFICSSCDTSCLTCHGPTLSDCDSCPPLTFLVYSTCYSTCPPHTYSITCQLCDVSCLNCTGPSSNQCTSCNELQMLHLNYSKCVSSCFEGDIADNSGMTCLTCPIGKTGYFKQCVSCYPTCYTCSDQYYNDCSSCVSTAAHSPNLLYNFNNQLDINSVIYLENATTCIYNNTAIIYMPSITNSSISIYEALLFVIWINLGVTLLLQIIFKYKTNLMLTLQTMQLLSYLYYFSSPLSQSNQIILLSLFNAHPTALIDIYRILPPLTSLVNIPTHANIKSIFNKAIILGKSGIFIVDGLYFHVFMLLFVLFFIIIRISRNSCQLYNKVNPYLLTYSFRLLFMELSFNAIIFFTYIELTQVIMRASLAILVIDLLIIACSFFWKVRTQLEPDHAHYALFYFNQLGPRKTNNQYHELTQQQQKQRKSILPSLVYYVSRLPLIITIILFHKQPLTQSICLLIYAIFLFAINFAIEYRRRIYRIMNLFTYFSLVLCSCMLVIMCCGIDVAIGLDLCILNTFMVLLACTLGQLFTNHQLFLSILDYVLARFFGRKRVKH